MDRKKGFSVIELLVVIGILGVLFAIGVPFYLNYRPRLILNRAAAQVRGDLMHYRQKAVTTSKPYLFRYDSDNNNYEVYRVEGEDTVSLEVKSLPEAIHLDGDLALPETLFFYPNGLTNGQGRLFLYHSGTLDTVRVIITRAGYVRYEQR